VDGWYVGTSHEHYRAHIIHVKATNSDRISETVFFKHKYLTNPTVTHADMVVKAAQDLYRALSKSPNWKSQQKLQGLQALSEVFRDIATQQDTAAEWDQPVHTLRQTTPLQQPTVQSPRVQSQKVQSPRVQSPRVQTQDTHPPHHVHHPTPPIIAGIKTDTANTSPLK